jgi:hypothetical protein
VAHYKVRYAIGEKGEYTYPEVLAGIVWKRLVYHGSDPVFIGETDDAVVPDKRDVVLIEADRTAKLVKEFESSLRPPAQAPEEAVPRPPEPPAAGGRASGRTRRHKAGSPRRRSR